MYDKTDLMPNQKIVFREERNVGLLFDPDSGRIKILNETGRFIWERLKDEKGRNEILTEILETYDCQNKETTASELDQFLVSLSHAGFLQTKHLPIPFPTSLCLGITSRCNFGCKHCLNRNQPDSDADMTTAQILSLIDEMGKAGLKGVSLFGGEPLAHPDFRLIVEKLNSYSISISLNTNGSLINDETAVWMKEHRISGAVVSFDGSSAKIMDSMRGKGAFESSLKGIKALRQAGINVLLSVTLNKLNYRDIRNMVVLGKEIGGNTIRFNHVFFTGNAACFVDQLYLSPEEERQAVDEVWKMKEEFGSFISAQSSFLCQKTKLDKVKDYKGSHDKITIPPCGAAMSKCAIRPDGWVVPCEIIWDVKCGNVKDQTLADIWLHSETMNSFRKPLEINLDELPECKGCSYQYLCFIGHRCYPYYYPGGIANRDLYCWIKNEKK